MDLTENDVGVVAAVNNKRVLADNLLQSPLIKKNRACFLGVDSAKSAAQAYNQGLDYFAHKKLVIFVHQDVYLPSQWFHQLVLAICQLETEEKAWSVIGVFGKDAKNESIGRVWDSGLGRELGGGFSSPKEAHSVDELLLVINTESQLQFDEHLPGFHLYGSDICTQANIDVISSYVVHAPVIHNSGTVESLGGDYAIAYRFMQNKWHNRLPIYAVCSPITKYGYIYRRIRFGLAYRRILGLLDRKAVNLHNPKKIADKLGYK